MAGRWVCSAGAVSLTWNASAGAAGYKVYYQADSAAQPFGTSIDVKNQTTATVDGLDPSHAYYFAVTAYDASGESSYSNIIAVNPLSVTLAGSGSGNINSTPSGIACATGTCTAQFANGSTITLSASPGDSSTSLSYFIGWGGDCTGVIGNICTLQMDANKSATATFTTLQPARINGGGYYSSLQSAYGGAANSDIIQAQAVTLTGDFTANSNDAITLLGGYNADYSGRSGYTEMSGTLLVAQGALIVDNLTIR